MDDETTGRLPDEDEDLTRVTPPDDATRVMPPAGEGETQVMPRADAGADTGATRVMPAGGQAPPPPPTQPTLLMTHGRPSNDRGVPWWVWLLVVLAVLAAAAALWYFYLRPADATTAGEEFIGSWSPQSGSRRRPRDQTVRRAVQDHRSTTISSRRPAPPRPTSWTTSCS